MNNYNEARNAVRVTINGVQTDISPDIDKDMPLLWYVRDFTNNKGTKFGCGIGQCGACTLHVNGEAIRSCSYPISALSSADSITTIEGLADGKELHPVQQAWKEFDVPQCGYCQGGQMMAAVDLLRKHPHPTDAIIDENHDNLCRCGTYDRIRKAIHRAAELMAKGH
ncbi:(2Fe-2S)-binding protein [Kordiimonas sp. SCSIO 12610]|uniref:(2Fe-2S)-binding protein n=1 Tax=Kordiimonas sp. SCSIO 12610 TaxID=2829597 RepID=UPI00210EA1C9|nr:(2Fe-2S)-binding protein [Kordiimonas sp. SCSIO 12610]UTW54666.1 (2Fe-2S)-binding protein [Kordiimonas sp. SCSIO 12610]